MLYVVKENAFRMHTHFGCFQRLAFEGVAIAVDSTIETRTLAMRLELFGEGVSITCDAARVCSGEINMGTDLHTEFLCKLVKCLLGLFGFSQLTGVREKWGGDRKQLSNPPNPSFIALTQRDKPSGNSGHFSVLDQTESNGKGGKIKRLVSPPPPYSHFSPL